MTVYLVTMLPHYPVGVAYMCCPLSRNSAMNVARWKMMFSSIVCVAKCWMLCISANRWLRWGTTGYHGKGFTEMGQRRGKGWDRTRRGTCESGGEGEWDEAMTSHLKEFIAQSSTFFLCKQDKDPKRWLIPTLRFAPSRPEKTTSYAYYNAIPAIVVSWTLITWEVSWTNDSYYAIPPCIVTTSNFDEESRT
jgi:hypothetical protein